MRSSSGPGGRLLSLPACVRRSESSSISASTSAGVRHRREHRVVGFFAGRLCIGSEIAPVSKSSRLSQAMRIACIAYFVS